jgi:hypothetical protein
MSGGRRGPLVAAGLFYVALALVSQRGLVAGLGDHTYGQPVPGNDCLLHAWTLAWDHHALATRPCALFDANILYPHARTLLYSDHLVGLAVVLAPLRLVTTNPLVVHNVATVIAPAVDGLAMFALAHALTGSAAGAFVGGILYGFAPVRVKLEHCQIQMLVAWWLPLFLLFASRALAENRVRPAIAAGLCLALEGLTGIYVSAFFLPFLALVHLWWLRRRPPRRYARGWIALLAAEAAAGLAVLPFLVAYRAVQHDLGASRSPVLNALLSVPPRDLGIHVPVVSLAVLAIAGVVFRRHVPARYGGALGPLLVLVLGSLVLACGPAIPLPGGMGQVRGPYAALFLVPGYDALRAPARFLQLTLLGAAPIAAGGVAALVSRVGTRRAVPLVAVLAIAAVAECWVPAPPTIDVWPPARDPVAAWIRTQPPTLRYVELPLDSWAGMSRYQYASTGHWHDTAIGNMGILPPLYPYLVHELRRFPDDDVVSLLGALGITHAVLHTRYLPRPTAERLAALRETFPVRFQAGDTAVVALPRVDGRDPVVLRGHPLDRRGWHATASAADGLASRAIDGDPASAWTSYGDLDASLARWWDRVPFAVRWQGFVAGNPVRFELDLGATASVTAVVLALGGSDPLVAPDLVLTTSEDGQRWVAFTGPLRPLPDVPEFIRRSAEARFAFVAPDPVRARFVRLSSVWIGEWRIADLDVHAE